MKYTAALVILLGTLLHGQTASKPPIPSVPSAPPSTEAIFIADHGRFVTTPDVAKTVVFGSESGEETIFALDAVDPVLLKHYRVDHTLDWIVMKNGQFVQLEPGVVIDTASKQFWKTFAGAFRTSGICGKEQP